MGNKRKILNKNGSTIVEVVVAFVVLAIITLMFSTAMKTSLNMVGRSQEINKFNSDALEAYYKKDMTALVEGPTQTLKLDFTTGNSTFDINLDMNSYIYTDGKRTIVIYEYTPANP